MKSYDKLIAAVIVLMIGVIAAVNLRMLKVTDDDGGGLYRVEINRVERELQSGSGFSPDRYETILGVYEYDGGGGFFDAQNEYVIREIDGRLYRIEYDSNVDKSKEHIRLIVNLVPGISFVLVLCVLIYVRERILMPFHKINELPVELAKGNLAVPLKESKSRYFGKFVWGLDMLREELESSKLQSLDKIKAEKTLLLSLSHDIKTPLAAIKLYSKALSKGLYTDPHKQTEIAESIDGKADEIERYVNEIIKRADDDFLNFEINMSELYMSQVIDKVSDGYRERLSAAGTILEVKEHPDCLLSGDADRLDEVLQNIIENAVKYGDGHIISMSFSDEEDCRLITVSNSGCTLPDTELAHIFDSFWRGSNTNGRQGSGLGLYICRRLMKDMGGDIFADISDGYMNVTLVCRKIG